jgi:HTH-type transcriptional regulator/antitoxin HigA
MTKYSLPLRSEADDEAALAEIALYFEREPQRGAPEAKRFDLLADNIDQYEQKRWPIAPATPTAES